MCCEQLYLPCQFVLSNPFLLLFQKRRTFVNIKCSSLPETDASMSKLMTSTWASFVTSGDPTPPGSAITWSQVFIFNKVFFVGLFEISLPHFHHLLYTVIQMLHEQLKTKQVTPEKREYLTFVNGTGTMGRSQVETDIILI